MAFVLENILPLILMLTGIIGNSIVIAVWSRKRFRKLYLRTIFQLEAFFKILAILQLLTLVSSKTFNYNISTLSPLMCKLSQYFQYSIPAMSAYLLVIISVERVITIRSPTSKSINLQRILICISVVYNLAFYAIFLDAYDLVKSEQRVTNNSTNATFNISSNLTRTNLVVVACDEKQEFYKDLTAFMDLVNSTLIPFIFMLVCSLVLIKFVFTARRKIKKRNTSTEQKRLLKDIQFSLTIMLLNADFMVFNLPVCVIQIIQSEMSFYVEMFFYAQFANNFIILLCCNKMFRDEFLTLLGLRKNKDRSKLYVTEQN